MDIGNQHDVSLDHVTRSELYFNLLSQLGTIFLTQVHCNEDARNRHDLDAVKVKAELVVIGNKEGIDGIELYQELLD